MSSSHHPIITTSPHPIIASSHLGTPHLLWKWLTNTTSQKIFLGGQTISLRFLTPQRGSINMRFAAFFKISQILKLNFFKFDKILQILRHLQLFFLKFHENYCFFKPIFCENFEIAVVQKDANLVEIEKCCQTHIFLQNFALIQPRTSPPKICKCLQNLCKIFQNLPILLPLHP